MAIQFQVIRNSDIFIHKFLRLEDAYANILRPIKGHK